MSAHKIRFAFFGTPRLSATILDELERAGYVPEIIVTAPDTPQGRGMTLTPPPVKTWGEARGIKVVQPRKITDEVVTKLKQDVWDVFVVAAYGKILPQALLDIPKHGTLNVHPSLLPRLRGPSPIRSAILGDEKGTGVSIILLDAEMDHGPILIQRSIDIDEWPGAQELEGALAHLGGRMLAEVLPRWIAGEIEAREQNHAEATFCKKIVKEDGLINLQGDGYKNLLKIRALEGWPGAYTFFERRGRRIRVLITAAHMENDVLVLDRVKPEGKNEMAYADFARTGAIPLA